MLQFPSLPNGIVKNCYYLQKLAEEKKLERESSFSFTANSASRTSSSSSFSGGN